GTASTPSSSSRVHASTATPTISSRRPRGSRGSPQSRRGSASTSRRRLERAWMSSAHIPSFARSGISCTTKRTSTGSSASACWSPSRSSTPPGSSSRSRSSIRTTSTTSSSSPSGFPSLSIVVDHLGKPPLGSGSLDDWTSRLRACAERPNVHAKLSGLNTTLERSDWDADDFAPAASVALELFGPERLMCGSDWPVALLNGDYDRVWHATRRLVELLAPGHEAALLGGNAARLYRFSANGG